MNTAHRSILIVIAIVVILAIVAYFYFAGSTTPRQTNTATSTLETYGTQEYADQDLGFTFWYPAGLEVAVSHPNSTTSFPGGVEVERLRVGPAGGVSISVVESASSTITDEPDQHASPILQTRYFYDASTHAWMVTYPEGTNTGAPASTTPADISRTTVAGLPMLPSGARFDTTIIPLSPVEFIVVQDGGGSSFTNELAATVAPLGAAVTPATLSSALHALSTASANE